MNPISIRHNQTGRRSIGMALMVLGCWATFVSSAGRLALAQTTDPASDRPVVDRPVAEKPGASAADNLRPWLERSAEAVRFATYNTAMNRNSEGQLLQELQAGDCEQAQKIAEVIQRVRPDVLLLCEIDRDSKQQTLEVFHRQYLQQSQNQQEAITYPYRYFAASNTGVPAGVDLNNNGKNDEADDAFGFGQFPGKYAMAVLSRFPFDEKNIRTYQKFRWIDMPESLWPIVPETQQPFYSDPAAEVFRLSSKSHWLLPIQTPNGVMHLAAAHPTPPVFDGPEDRNGKRNHDEIRLLANMIDHEAGQYLVDDAGRPGGLNAGAKFVVAGDLNADPRDGDSSHNAIDQLLRHPLINSDHTPSSLGATQASAEQGGVNLQHRGESAHDTSDFNDQNVGNLRLDYVLPSKTLTVLGSGVFWPSRELPEHEIAEASDHRLVWIDVK